MNKDFPLFQLEQRIGYRFRNAGYMERALTHSSMVGSPSNERMEFLGDRVLNLVMAHTLYEQFAGEAEGALNKRHAALVQGRMLLNVATAINLSDFLILSDAERGSGGAGNANILADAMEALLGAIFLDGGLDAARDVIIRLWDKQITAPSETHQDTKTELQELVQARGLPLPAYEIVNRSGPDHAPVFEVEARVRGYDPVVAEGRSRQQAEKEAARIMLLRIRNAQ